MLTEWKFLKWPLAVSIMPLTFGRGRIVVSHRDKTGWEMGYEDGW